jgi:hypothetical protein
VTFDFFDRRRSAERFAELLDETTAGRHHQYQGAADEQLAELVAIGHSLSAARPGVQVDPGFRSDLRAMLVAAAERDGIGSTAEDTADEGETVAPARGFFGRAGRRLRTRGVIVVGVAAGAMAVSGISAASESAAPGSAFYQVKRSTERAQLAMAGSDITRGRLSLDFARNRLAEAAVMRGDHREFRDALDDMDADTRKGVRLLTSSAVTRKEPSTLDSVDSFVEQQRGVLTPAVDRLGPVNQERAHKSLGLLEAVRKRSHNVRTGLACDAEPIESGADALGPKLSACGDSTGKESAKPDVSAGGKRPSGQDGDEDRGDAGKPSTATGKDTQTSGSTPKATTDGDSATVPAPGKTGDAKQPADDAATEPVTPLDAPDPVVSDDPQNPPTSEDKGLLGGLLKGIFGS